MSFTGRVQPLRSDPLTLARRAAGISPKQVTGLEYITKYPVWLTAQLRFYTEYNPNRQYPAIPHHTTLSSLLIKGAVARTPNQRAGVTLEGLRLLGCAHSLMPDIRVPHYRPAEMVHVGMLLDLENDPHAMDPGEPSVYQSECAQVLGSGPALGAISLHVATAHEDDVIPFPPEHLVRVIGHVDENENPVQWDGA